MMSFESTVTNRLRFLKQLMRNRIGTQTPVLVIMCKININIKIRLMDTLDGHRWMIMSKGCRGSPFGSLEGLLPINVEIPV